MSTILTRITTWPAVAAFQSTLELLVVPASRTTLRLSLLGPSTGSVASFWLLLNRLAPSEVRTTLSTMLSTDPSLSKSWIPKFNLDELESVPTPTKGFVTITVAAVIIWVPSKLKISILANRFDTFTEALL